MNEKTILNDIEKIYKKAIEDNNLSIAIKIKELQMKIINKKDDINNLNISNFSDEQIKKWCDEIKFGINN